ncbi:hypothetical protein SAMN05421813_11374 [Daejeonella rubra]|uniref:Uncharacterized protein n=1 Tax=Daejeonella rubra TaxID=990371 RepID=A0A1G9TM21_9SPHI|nr:hypothetical protein [Daejeonella rubra]SDM48712.1 hypothetical protein SAMN05421813_11374 [Daejeonella rubra]
MENNKTLSVFNKVRNLTIEGKLIWKEEADVNTFFASVGDYKIYIGKSVGTISFELFNHLYEKIGMLEYGGYSTDTEGLDVFYEQIRRNVQSTDDGLDDLLDQLDSID